MASQACSFLTHFLLKTIARNGYVFGHFPLHPALQNRTVNTFWRVHHEKKGPIPIQFSILAGGGLDLGFFSMKKVCKKRENPGTKAS